jgi:hypothetical protein
MKLKIRSLAFLTLAIFISSCKQTRPKFSGTWQKDGGASGKYTWKVESDHITAEFQGKSIDLSYTLDRSYNPHWLDITGLDETHLCIFEFLDADTFRVAGLDGENGRPLAFSKDDNTLVFEKIK